MDKIIIEALKFAGHKHRYQMRRYAGMDPIPYFNHPLDLMHILGVEASITDTNILAAALLHDTLEDTDTSVEELATLFGPRITEIVMELTDDQEPAIEERYEAQIRKTPLYSAEAKLVKLADRIANLRDATMAPMPEWSQERLFGHFKQARRQVDLLSGTNEILEKLFNETYALAEKIMQNAAK